ncbi:hypothetical protein JTE90_022943 [Oedothorax gibbosus]|uniref:Uncharacterized protein n=1 Tax=Oedothorax gibbosus TaxID=931172 RepID=A0AAV6U7F7_9ARAC|nr:hypothetical protein JTE90_022943 [Oedothorax gibbosus]
MRIPPTPLHPARGRRSPQSNCGHVSAPAQMGHPHPSLHSVKKNQPDTPGQKPSTLGHQRNSVTAQPRT